ncbi:IclR family transcriptional regulator C-terminal domain-containing protein, partial [Stenotrophomonas maltophilia]|uniref:IclR family transcriptional regulator C-terminal domain-containing protein n=1 Tax=Stenotrophomonas maltophilia TaxID=40324 RepID=UPI001EF7D675
LQGYALNEQETELDLLGASVLVRSRAGRPVAALNTSSYLGRGDRRRMIAEIVPKLQACAEKLTGILL